MSDYDDKSFARIYWCHNCDETWTWNNGEAPHVCKLLECECCGRRDSTVSRRACAYAAYAHNKTVYEVVCDACERQHGEDILKRRELRKELRALVIAKYDHPACDADCDSNAKGIELLKAIDALFAGKVKDA